MKNILVFLIVFLFIFNLNLPIFAINVSKDKNSAASLLEIKDKEKNTYIIKDSIPENIKIQKIHGKYGVINKDNGNVLIPYKYEKIKKLGVDTVKVKENGKWGILTLNNKLVMKSNFEKIYIWGVNKDKPKDIVHSIYFGKKGKNLYAATPGRTSKDLFEKTFIQNNKISWIKFYDYPQEGIIVLTNGKKYGFLMTKGVESWIIRPQYDDFYIQDRGTTIFQQFNVSYTNPDNIIVKKGDKWGILNIDGSISVDFQYDNVIMLDSTIEEDVIVGKDEIALFYKSITFPMQDKLIAKRDGYTYIIDKKGNIYAKVPTVPNQITFNNYSSNNFLEEIYKENNSKAFVKFENFPKTGMYVTKSKQGKLGIVICKNNGNKIIPQEYQEFKFQDSNTGIYKQLGISFDNPNRILAKKNDKWGIIDEDNNVVTDFIYDSFVVLAARPFSVTNFDKSGVNIKYKKIEFPYSNILLAKKEKLYGVINRDGDVLIPFKYKFVKKTNKHKYAIEDGDKIAMVKEEPLTMTDAIITYNNNSNGFGETIGMIIMAPFALAGFIILSPILIPMIIAFGGGC